MGCEFAEVVRAWRGDAELPSWRPCPAAHLKNIPASEQWDLVVGNPPFYPDSHRWEIRSYDKDWHIHRSFFANVGRFLKPGGAIFLQEANDASTPDTFRGMIEDGGLTLVRVYNSKPGEFSRFYLGVIRRGETPPAWLTNPL